MISLQAVRTIDTPIGKVAIGVTDRGVSDVEILTGDRSRSEFSDSEQASHFAEQAAIQLAEYFFGDRKAFDVPLDLVGTAFQKAVWQQIQQIGFGDDSNYGSIANILNNPSASRAVGGAVGANPVPILIGCHRILGSNRKLTGYSGGEGLKTKRWLLKHEGIEHL